MGFMAFIPYLSSRQGASRRAQQFSSWPLRSAPGSLGTYGFLTPPYGLPYGLELKNNPRLCTSLRVYASNTPQEAAIDKPSQIATLSLTCDTLPQPGFSGGSF